MISLSKWANQRESHSSGRELLTVLQFIDFMSQLVRGDMHGWLNERKWKVTDLKSKLTKKVNIDFCVQFSSEKGEYAGRWEATYSPSRNHCTWERIDLLDSVLEIIKDTVEITSKSSKWIKSYKIAFDKPYKIAFDYEGSILSALKEELLPTSIRECKKFLEGVKSLDLLAPEHLRQRTRETAGTLGLGGQNLSAFLHEMSDQKRLRLVAKLKRAYPRLQGLHAKSLRSGWKQLEITEGCEGQDSDFLPPMTIEARHINDGMLRLIAILAELESEDQFLLFDEIENGINPELVEFVIDLLVNASQQVLVTTHSPMILNYLHDETAKDGVVYLYKTPQGHTKSIPFFSIPSLKMKLRVMGPGEAFVDTNLTKLAEEIADIPKEEA